MSLIDDLLSVLRTDYKPGPGEFSRLNRQNLIDRLHIKEKGRERGAKGIPAADATSLDTVEQEIVDAMNTFALNERTRTLSDLRVYEDRLRSLNPKSTSSKMLATAKESVADFESLMTEVRADLDRDRKEVVEREKALSDFKRKHKLDRPPAMPISHLAGLAWLSLAFLMDAAPNALFLSEGSEFGYLGGFVSALSFTAGNMFGGWCLGRFALHHLNHRSFWHKLFGLLLGVLSIGLVCGSTLLSAHYRNAIVNGSDELAAIHLAPITLWNDPLLFLGDVKSISMVFLGIVSAVITAIDGFKWIDPYPGYTRIAKEAAIAQDQWAQSVADHVDEVKEVYKGASAKISHLQSQINDHQLLLPETISNRVRVVEAFNLQLVHIEEVTRYLIDVYREANCETRKEPKPVYFSEKWKMHGHEPIQLSSDSGLVNDGDWSEVGTALTTAMDSLVGAHSSALKWIAEIERSGRAMHAEEAASRYGLGDVAAMTEKQAVAGGGHGA